MALYVGPIVSIVSIYLFQYLYPFQTQNILNMQRYAHKLIIKAMGVCEMSVKVISCQRREFQIHLNDFSF